MTAHKKPWGNYRTVHKGPGYQVKRIEVRPGLRLSLQKHRRRAETWIIVSGKGTALVGPKRTGVKPGVVVRVPAQKAHRIHNTGRKPLIFIEVQIGEYLGEDDITRLQDDFGRAKRR